MSGAPHRILPLDGQAPPFPMRPRDLDQLLDVADRTRFGGVGGLPGMSYTGQGYTEVPSLWLCEMIARLRAAEGQVAAARAGCRPPPSQGLGHASWQDVLDRPIPDDAA